MYKWWNRVAVRYVSSHIWEISNGWKVRSPTPYGVIEIRHEKGADGKVISHINAPEEIRVTPAALILSCRMYIIIEYMKQTICIYAFAALLLGGCKSNNELTIPTNLRTEYLTEPIGLDTSSPRFYMGNTPEMRRALRLPAMRYGSVQVRTTCGPMRKEWP